MRIAVGSDHGGFQLKSILIDHLKKMGHIPEDLGCFSGDSVDYPDFAVAVAQAVAAEKADLGIMIDGAGVGSTMAANKVSGVRAALCNDIYTAGNAREHNNANMLVMGSMVVGSGKALQISDKFLITQFAGGRHQLRVDKINALDNRSIPGSQGGTGDLADIVRQVVQNLANVPASRVPQPENRSLNNPSVHDTLITESILRDLVRSGQREIHLASGTVVTPLARDYARDNKIRFIR